MPDMFIKLGDKKQAIEKWSKAEFRYNAATIAKETNYAFIPPEGYCILDADNKEAVDRITTILANMDITPVTWPTDKGRHWLFKITEHVPPMKPGSLIGGAYNILGLKKLDYKGYNKGYAKISGRVDPQTVENYILNDDPPELPLILYPNKAGFDMTNFPEGERHEIMFRMWIPKLRKHWSNDKDMLKGLIYQIVKGFHCDPDSPAHIAEWVNTNVDTSFEKGMINTELRGKYDAYIMMNKLGIGNMIMNYAGIFETLIKELRLIQDIDSKQIWGLEDNRQQPILDLAEYIRRELFTHSPNIKPSIIGELITAMPARVPRRRSDVKPYEIVFKNGVYNVYTKEFVTKDIEFAPNLIPHMYIPDDDALFRKRYQIEIDFIMRLFEDWSSTTEGVVDKEMVTELFETIGYMMTKLMDQEKATMLLGNGANGKSIYIKLLVRVLGQENTSAEDLKFLTDGVFSSAQLYGKLANINADISSGMIKDPATFKRIVSGDLVSAQYKNKDPFTFESYAMIILGVNNVPYVNEPGESDAIDRRMRVLEFKNKFVKSKHFYKVMEYLYNTRTLSVVIRLALDKLYEMFEGTGLFTVSKRSHAALERYLLETDHVAEFLSAITLKDGVEEAEVFSKYKAWSESNSYKPISKMSLTKKAMKFYRRRGITLVPTHIKQDGIVKTTYIFYR